MTEERGNEKNNECYIGRRYYVAFYLFILFIYKFLVSEFVSYLTLDYDAFLNAQFRNLGDRVK